MDNVSRGILFVFLSMACFVTLDTVAKFMAGVIDPLQVVWGRYVFSVLLLPVIIPPRRLRLAVRTKRPWLQLLRSVLLVSTTAAFFTAIKYMPLADAIAIGFVAPLIGTALSIPVLKEKVGLRRWSAIAIGLVGVLIILRPGFEERHWAYFLPLAAATMMAVPCWSSWKTGMPMRSFSVSSTSKHSGALISSRLMPPKVGSSASMVQTIRSTSGASISMSKTSMPANFLNRTALPSMTGLEASGPILPSPRTADPFDTTPTRFERAV